MRDYYAKRAPIYNESMRYGTEARDIELVSVVESLVASCKGQEVLEVACGPGFWSAKVASHARSLTAVDATPEMTALARDALNQFSNVDVLDWDAYQLSRLNRKFSVIFMVDWWSHVPRAQVSPFVYELGEVLKPAGKVIVIDGWAGTGYGTISTQVDPQTLDTIQMRKLPNGQIYPVVKNTPTEHELRDAFRSPSFDSDSTHYVSDAASKRWIFEVSAQK